MSNDGISFDDVQCIQETERAVLIEGPPFDEPTWIPKSCLHDDSEVFDAAENSEGRLVVKAWWAEKQGWAS